MRRMVIPALLVVCLAGCVSLPTPMAARSPLPQSEPYKVYLPLYKARVTSWPWQSLGYGIANEWQQVQPPTGALAGLWWYDWTPRCNDAHQVQMVWGGGAGEVQAARSCNDGRPLLILNEPERKDQANVAPAVAARLVNDLAQWWAGPLWCCGQNAAATDWTDEFVRLYHQQYGPLPLDGWHVHAYTNDTLDGAWFGTVVDPARVEQVMRNADAFHARYSGPMLLSECGVLTGDWWHTPAQVAPVATAFRASLARRPYIVSAAWFSARAPSFHPSDLLELSGHLTDVGQAWLR